jgi:hypothetical protein
VDAPSITDGDTLVWDADAEKFVGDSLGGGEETDTAALAAVAALTALVATDAELSAAAATLTAGIAAKQDSATAATDAELAAAVATLNTAMATDDELASAVSNLMTAIGLKQDALTAATDTELTAAVAAINAVVATDLELAAAIAAHNASGIAHTDIRSAVTAHTDDIALDGGPHGFPALTVNGMGWRREGGALVAVAMPSSAEVAAGAADLADDIAALAVIDGLSEERELLMQDGTWAPQIPWGATSAPSLAAGRVFYLRFVLPKAMTIRSVTFGLQVADTVDNPVHCGIYSAAGARLATSGAVSGKMNAAAPDKMKVTIPDTALLANTVYYAAFLVPTVTTGTTSVLFTTPGNAGLLTAFGAVMPTAFVMWENSQTSLPTTAAPIAASSTNAGPLVIVRTAA